MSQLEIGDVVTARFPEHDPQGHEQEGYRPAIVLGLPGRLGQPRFDLVLVVPLTTDHGQSWAAASPDLYPRLRAGMGGLPRDSILLLEQIRTLDTSRMSRYLGQLSKAHYEPIRRGLARMCRLER
ncbi:MAG: type II toxin-antitoxin system PemK/MazF family toxin [Deinococcus sp.]|nr:type II toxin-antitoxin system PemK/MazF family toxin [Deinococcus sp.]